MRGESFIPSAPPGSSARVERHADGIRLFFPPLGQKAVKKFVPIGVGFWNLLTIPFAILFYYAAITRGIASFCDPPTKAWLLFPLPFLLVGVSSLWLVYRMGRRQAEIVLDSETLRVSYLGLLGNNQREWPRETVFDVSTGYTSYESNDGPVCLLRIQLKEGPVFRLLNGRGEPELAWAASVLRQVLRSYPSPQKPEEQPATPATSSGLGTAFDSRRASGTAGSPLAPMVRRATHSGAVQALAESLGRPYARAYSLPPWASSLPLFAGSTDCRDAMTDRAEGSPMDLFDYNTVNQRSQVKKGTAALMPVEGLMAFDLRPRTRFRRSLEWTGLRGLTFDPALARPVDAATVQRFTERFQLFVLDPDEFVWKPVAVDSKGLQEKEEAVRRLFTPVLMGVFNRYPDFAVQSRPGFLAVYHGSGVLPASKRTELRDAAVILRKLLINPPDRDAERVVPGLVGMETSRQTQKLQSTVCAAMAGLLIGFVVAIWLINHHFLRHGTFHAGQPPGQWLVLAFFGLTLGGGALGAVVGSQMPIRTRSAAMDSRK